MKLFGELFFSLLLIGPIIHAATVVFYVAPHPNTGENYVLGTRGERQDHYICVAPLDDSGNQVTYVGDLDVAPDNCVYNSSKRQTRLDAYQVKQDSMDATFVAAKSAYQRLNSLDFDNATNTELKAAVKDIWLIEKGLVKHLRPQ